MVANSADGKPHPASSVLKLRGSRAAAGGHRAARRRRRPAVARRPAPTTAPTSPTWARRAAPQLPELPQGLDLRRLQRGAAHHHRRHDPGVVRSAVDFTYDERAGRPPRGRPRPAGQGLLRRRAAPRRSSTADPGFDEKTWSPAGRDGRARACRSPRRTAAWAPARSRSAIVAEEIGRVLAPEPFIETRRAGRRPGRRRRHRRAAGRGPRRASPRAARSLAFAHAEPGTRWTPTAAGGHRHRRAATAGRCPASRSRSPSGARADLLVVSAARPTAAPGCSWSRATPSGLTRTGYRTHDGGRAARVAFDGTPADAARRAATPTDRRHRPGAGRGPHRLRPTRRSARWTPRCGRPRSTSRPASSSASR